MGSQTAAGTSLAISATGPATHDAAGYAALTFVDIGQVEKLGSFGATFAKSEFQPLKGAKQKYKGSSDNGAIQPSIAIDSADAGQTLLQTAAEDETQKLYSFCVTFADGAKRYFRGRVFGSPETADGADSMVMTTPTVEISTRVVKVAAAVVAPTPAPTFSTQPSVTPTSGTAGATTFTATPGTVTNGIVSSRVWMLNGISISTTLSASPQSAGTLTYQETAAGAGGSAVSTVISTTVAAAPSPTVTLSAAQSKSEGNSGATLFTYTVTRSKLSGAVAVPWSFTAGGTSADDFTGGTYPTGGTVNMADGVATGTFSVSVNGDTVVEGDETFTVLISTPSGYVAGTTTSASGTILNDDTAAAPALQAVTSRNFWNTGPGGTTTSGTVKQLSRVGYWIGQGDVSEVSVMLTTYYSSDVAGPGFTARCDFEYNGVCVPFTWDNGTTTRVLASGDHDVVAVSIPASAFGVSKIPAGARVFTKLEREFAEGVAPPYVGTRLAQTGDNCMRGPTGSTSKIGVAGAVDTSGGYVSYDVLIVPTIVLGRPVTTMPAVITVGASIEAGTGDDNNRGYTNRATSMFPYVASMNLATSAESANQFVATPGKRMSCAKYFNIGLNGFGGNDYSQAKTKEQAATALAQVNAAYKALGIKKIGQLRMSPKSNSDGNDTVNGRFRTVEGQTVRSTPIDFNTYRDYVDAQARLDTNVNLLIDTTGGSEPAGVPGKWRVDGTDYFPTNDGTHPNSPVHITMAPYARTGIDTLIGML